MGSKAMFSTMSFKGARRCAGLTLVELMITLLIAGLVISLAVGLWMSANESFVAQFNYVDLDNAAQLALDRMSQQIRQSIALSNCSPTQLTLMDSDGVPLTFIYSPTNRTLSRSKGGTSEILLQGCDSMQFSMFRRTAMSNSDQFYATTNPAVCRIIQIQWNCSRMILGKKMTTESMQTARVVMRNH